MLVYVNAFMISAKIIINLKDILKFEIFLYNDCYNVKIRYSF